MEKQTFTSLDDFYTFYLSEHADVTNRRLHFLGTSCALILLCCFLLTLQWQYIATAFICAYGFAWLGHFIFEKNKPATFQHPLRSFACDWIMYKDIWIGRISLKE